MFRRLFTWFGLLSLAPLAGLALGIALSVDRPDLGPRLLALVGVMAGCALLASLGVSAAVAHRLSRPLRELADAAERLGAGGGGGRVSPDGGDEVGQLGRAFNHMSERLATRISQLEEDRQQLRTILSAMVEGVVALDAQQRILFANDRAAKLLEFPTQAPVGRRLWEVVRQRPLLDVVRRALHSPEPQREELGWNGATAQGGRSLTVHAARLPGLPPGNSVRGAVLVLHDTSELRRLERLRQEFVANVSHELKTPLSVIKVCVETLLDGAMEDPRHRLQFLEQIAGQGDRLHALILDLLSLARIESGAELFDFQPVPLEPVVRACLERHRPRAEARQQTLSLEAPSGARPPDPAAGPDPAGGVAVWADEEALDQILDNLLDNALKYTPEGGHVRVGWRSDDGQVCVEVADTGIGIPEADLPRIFERFYRVDKARSREMGGTGLGLSIVKHLAQAMHGSVRAASRLGHGTTFSVSLPRA
jgi:two-component system phosphate regulon sensor histidine kinase PhoR